MFDSGDNLPTTKKWSCQNKIKDLEKENKILTNQINLLIKDSSGIQSFGSILISFSIFN